MFLAETVVFITGIYLSIGVLFALYFVTFGITKLDTAAQGTGFFFRILIFFGAVIFWILLLRRLFAGQKRPTENNAHRQRSMEAK